MERLEARVKGRAKVPAVTARAREELYQWAVQRRGAEGVNGEVGREAQILSRQLDERATRGGKEGFKDEWEAVRFIKSEAGSLGWQMPGEGDAASERSEGSGTVADGSTTSDSGGIGKGIELGAPVSGGVVAQREGEPVAELKREQGIHMPEALRGEVDRLTESKSAPDREIEQKAAIAEAGKAGRRSAIQGPGIRLQAIREWQDSAQGKPGYTAEALEEFVREYDGTRDAIRPHVSLIRNSLKAMQRVEQGIGSAEDERVRDEFAWKLATMPERERRAVMLAILGDKEIRGEAQHLGEGNERDVLDTFLGSMKRTFQDMFGDAAFEHGVIEDGLEALDPNAPQPAERYLAGPNDALKLAYAHINRKYLERFGGMPNAPKPSATPPLRELDPVERRQLQLVKDDLLRMVQIDRDLVAAARATDPFDESVLGKMAAGTGSSVAAMLPAIVLGPQGALLSGMGYQSATYEELRSKYPEMSPQKAAELSLISGAAQGALDMLGVKGLKVAPSLMKLLTRPSLEVGKRAGKQAALTVAVENFVELGQDYSTPVVQHLAHALQQDIPEVNWDEELRNFWQGRADVALGMLPLTLLGIGAATVNEVGGARRMLADNEQLGRAGVQWEDRVRVKELAKQEHYEEAYAALREAWPRRTADEAAGFHRQWEQQQQAGGGRATSGGAPLKARTDKPASWEQVKPGHSWTSSKQFLPKLSDKRPGFGVKRGSWEFIVSKVAKWLGVMPKVTDPWGGQVIFANPQQRGRFADPLENRAAHLVGMETDKGTEHRQLDAEKLGWIGATRKTIEDAQLRVRALTGETLYFRTYAEGVHMVVVVDGAVKDQYALVTQYAPELGKSRFEGALVERIRQVPGLAPQGGPGSVGIPAQPQSQSAQTPNPGAQDNSASGDGKSQGP